MDYNSYDWLIYRLKAPGAMYLDIKINRDFSDAVDRAITELEKMNKENQQLKARVAELESQLQNRG